MFEVEKNIPCSWVQNLPQNLSVLGFGSHKKNTLCLLKKQKLKVSRIFGDLGEADSRLHYEKNLEEIFSAGSHERPIILVCDCHPDYASSLEAKRFAKEHSIPLLQVQHHRAHMAAAMVEYDLNVEKKVLGFVWDGTGLGLDNTLWGAEAFFWNGETMRRVASLKPFSLPGGAQAIREPWRLAFALLFEIFDEREIAAHFENRVPRHKLAIMSSIIKNQINSPRCSSMGRFFDAISSLIGLRDFVSFEGQAAVELEQMIDPHEKGSYTYKILEKNGLKELDWSFMVQEILEDLTHGVSQSVLSSRFHNTWIEIICHMAHEWDVDHIILSGGCFQNHYLCDQVNDRLQKTHKVYVPRILPPNDQGISLGQVFLGATEFLKR